MKGYKTRAMREQPKPEGLISFATNHLGRYRDFDRCLANLKTPFPHMRNVEEGANIAENQNRAIAGMLHHKLDWIWTLNDDHTFLPDLLVNLLDRDVDIVFPLYLYRSHPIKPVLAQLLPDGSSETLGMDFVQSLILQAEDGLVRLPTGALAGGGGMLCKRSVLEKMNYPWMDQGQLTPGFGAEDLYFCKKVHDLGIPVYLDLKNTMGHMTHVSIWPKIENEKIDYSLKLPRRG